MGDRFRVVTNYRLSRDAVDEVFSVGMVPLDDYAVLDVSGAYTLGERLEVFARWQNVTEEDYQEVAGFNTMRSRGWAARTKTDGARMAIRSRLCITERSRLQRAMPTLR